ncbi:hypothetical protein L3V82_05710 [Thiotrichales bacterium 19S3-7]|nr:hypothetical protein [Thiotrichales bacterium 19S3-7]MCF6801590.1 hypothetical protein [Thiotrichales bacterium 19S3-11]
MYIDSSHSKSLVDVYREYEEKYLINVIITKKRDEKTIEKALNWIEENSSRYNKSLLVGGQFNDVVAMANDRGSEFIDFINQLHQAFAVALNERETMDSEIFDAVNMVYQSCIMAEKQRLDAPVMLFNPSSTPDQTNESFCVIS